MATVFLSPEAVALGGDKDRLSAVEISALGAGSKIMIVYQNN
jgi:hypothetical protein